MTNKYPKTKHLQGSKSALEPSYTDVSTLGHVVVEEKLDGCEVCIRTNDYGQLDVTHNGQSIRSYGNTFQFLHDWFYIRQNEFKEALGDSRELWLEWMLPKKTVFYDDLPSYAMVFDVYDTDEEAFLSTPRRKELLRNCNVTHVPVLYEGPASKVDLESLTGRSAFITKNNKEAFLAKTKQNRVEEEILLSETDLSGMMEGLYVKEENQDHVTGWYKYVREEFVTIMVESGSHWRDRVLVRNSLRDENG